MSLTTDIAALVARYEALATVFDNKKAAIDASVSEALETVPEGQKIIYVNQITGSDENSGLSSASPVASFGRAVALGGASRAIFIRLLADYVMTATVDIPPNSSVRVMGWGAKRKLTLQVIPWDVRDNEGLFEWKVSGFFSPLFGRCTLNIVDCEIVFPVLPAGVTLPAARYNALLGTAANKSSPLVEVGITQTTLTRPAGAVGWVLGADATGCGVLTISGSTYVTADMQGKWVADVAAGTAATAVPRLVTNLSTL